MYPICHGSIIWYLYELLFVARSFGDVFHVIDAPLTTIRLILVAAVMETERGDHDTHKGKRHAHHFNN